jgi:hypothetical protein
MLRLSRTVNGGALLATTKINRHGCSMPSLMVLHSAAS